jgi:hypothetical protein
MPPLARVPGCCRRRKLTATPLRCSQVTDGTVAGIAAAAGSLAARFPRVEEIFVDLRALCDPSKSDAARLAAGLAASGVAVLRFSIFESSRRPPPAHPGAVVARLEQLRAALGGGGRLRSLDLRCPCDLTDGQDPVWPALAALPACLTSLRLYAVANAGMVQLARRAPALGPSLRDLQLGLARSQEEAPRSLADARRFAGVAAVVSHLTALRSLSLYDSAQSYGRLAAWLPPLRHLTSLSDIHCAACDLPALATLPALAELQLQRWMGDEPGGEPSAATASDSANPHTVAASCASVTKLVCNADPLQLASLVAAFPSVVDARIAVVNDTWKWPPEAIKLPAPPALAWRGLRRLCLSNERGVHGALTPVALLRQLCGAGCGWPLTLRQLTLTHFTFFEFRREDRRQLAELLAAAVRLECLSIGRPPLTVGAFAGFRHAALRRLHSLGSEPWDLDTADLLALGAALPNLESLHLGWWEADGVAAAWRLDVACGGDGSCAAPTARELAAQEEGIHSHFPTFEGRPWGGPLLRAIRGGLERQVSGGGGSGSA